MISYYELLDTSYYKINLIYYLIGPKLDIALVHCLGTYDCTIYCTINLWWYNIILRDTEFIAVYTCYMIKSRSLNYYLLEYLSKHLWLIVATIRHGSSGGTDIRSSSFVDSRRYILCNRYSIKITQRLLPMEMKKLLQEFSCVLVKNNICWCNSSP